MLGSMLFAAMLASPQAPAPTPTAGQAAAPPEKRICKRVGNPNSRIKATRLCMFKAEWDELRRENNQDWDSQKRG